MRVHTRIVFSMVTGHVLEDEWYEYEGPVARCQGDGGDAGDAGDPGAGPGAGDAGAAGVGGDPGATGVSGDPGAVSGDPTAVSADPASMSMSTADVMGILGLSEADVAPESSLLGMMSDPSVTGEPESELAIPTEMEKTAWYEKIAVPLLQKVTEMFFPQIAPFTTVIAPAIPAIKSAIKGADETEQEQVDLETRQKAARAFLSLANPMLGIFSALAMDVPSILGVKSGFSDPPTDAEIATAYASPTMPGHAPGEGGDLPFSSLDTGDMWKRGVSYASPSAIPYEAPSVSPDGTQPGSDVGSGAPHTQYAGAYGDLIRRMRQYYSTTGQPT